MNRLVPVLLAVAALSCSREPAPVAAKKAEPAKPAPSGVVLDAAAQKAAGIAVEEVRPRSIPNTVRAVARLTQDENQTWRIGAVTEGRVVKVLANPGDPVKQGQVLARLHSHEIHEGRAAYRKAVAELARLESSRDFARRVRDRARRLYDIKAGSLEQAEHAETGLRNAETEVANARIELERTRNHLVEFLGVSAEDEHPTHQDDDDLIPVRSPAGGTVVTRNITPGAVVSPSTDLFVVADLSRLWAVAEVSEEHLPRLRPGMPARTFVQAYGDRAFPGKIARLGDALDPATRTVKVRIELPNPGGLLKPEMFATSEIETGGSEPAIFVPRGALQDVRGQTVVFVRTAPDRFQTKPVESGRSIGESVEIVRGLSGGETVAVQGAFVLKSEFLKSTLAEE